MKKSKNVVLYNVAIVAMILVFLTSMFGFFKGIFSGRHGGGEETTTFTTAIVEVEKPTQAPTPDVPDEPAGEVTTGSSGQSSFTFEIPDYTGEPFYVINNNVPDFKTEEITASVFENYSELDGLGRCGVAYANICIELMPDEAREEIGSVKPSGWTYSGKSNNNKYDFVDGKYVYNRCHLIGFQLAGENANPKNLITGTRYINVNGMLPFENMVADYVKNTGNHVLYRVTPIFNGNELVCRGVLMEAYSVEDNGYGVEFCVFCHNVQPGVEINYLTGQNQIETAAQSEPETQKTEGYVLNDNSKKFHLPSCKYASTVSSNQRYVSDARDHLIEEGYVPCKVCNP